MSSRQRRAGKSASAVPKADVLPAAADVPAHKTNNKQYAAHLFPNAGEDAPCFMAKNGSCKK